MASNRSSTRLSQKTIAEMAPLSDEEETTKESEVRHLSDALGSDHDDDQDFIAGSPTPSNDSDSDSESESWKSKVKKRRRHQKHFGNPCKIQRKSLNKDSLGPSNAEPVPMAEVSLDGSSDDQPDEIPDIEEVSSIPKKSSINSSNIANLFAKEKSKTTVQKKPMKKASQKKQPKKQNPLANSINKSINTLINNQKEKTPRNADIIVKDKSIEHIPNTSATVL